MSLSPKQEQLFKQANKHIPGGVNSPVRAFNGVGVFKELKNKGYFCTVRLWAGTIQWPNEQDFCPDMLYAKSKKIY